jgi:hypothetical protein
MPMRMLLACALCCLSLAACGDGEESGSCTTQRDCPAGWNCVSGRCVAPVDADVGDGEDGEVPDGDASDGDDAGCPAAAICGADCCGDDERCWHDLCVRDAGTCAGGEACLHDSTCVEGVCVPWGTPGVGEFDETCRLTEPVDGFAPVVQCEYAAVTDGVHPERTEAASTPLVADFGLPTGRPAIVIGTAAGWALSDGTLRILDGLTCELLYSIGTDTAAGGAPALADITGDGRPEIVALAPEGGLIAFAYDAPADAFVQLWRSGVCDGAGGRVPDTTGGNWMLTGPSVHDLDDDGTPEIVHCNAVFDADGCLHGRSASWAHFYGQAPLLADVDEDGAPELVEANGVYRYDAATQDFVLESYWHGGATAGATAVGELGDFPLTTLPLVDAPEVVVVGAGQVWVQTIEGDVVFGPVTLPGGGQGPPTVSDFDGDGLAEFAAAGGANYVVFDLAEADGILWQQPSQDLSSAFTGSSIFDFAADGAAEAVYSDECFVRAYDGATGAVLFSQAASSGTAAEYPIVADVDGDFRSELVVPTNSYPIACPAQDPLYTGPACASAIECPPGQTCPDGFCRVPYVLSSGVRVYADVTDRWASSRPIWNQYAYHVTHVNDDGTVPATAAVERNWDVPGLNNFRQNVLRGLPADATPNLTARNAEAPECSEAELRQPLAAEVCNRGTLPVPAGVLVEFRIDTLDGELACTDTTDGALDPGACERVWCDWLGVPLSEAHDVWVVPDPPPAGPGVVGECREDDSLTFAAGVQCPPLIG